MNTQNIIIGCILIALILSASTALYFLLDDSHEAPPTPQAHTETTYYPENNTARVTITDWFGGPDVNGTVRAKASWSENESIYQIEPFAEPVGNGSQVILENIHPNSTIRVWWVDSATGNKVILGRKYITPNLAAQNNSTADEITVERTDRRLSYKQR